MKSGISLTAVWVLTLSPITCVLAQVNHCVTLEGRHIYTDQGCSAFSAYRVNDLPPDFNARSGDVSESGLPDETAHVCAQELDDLENRLHDALTDGNLDDLIRLIQWDSASRYTVDQLIPALEQISQRPLRDLRVVFDFDESNWHEIRPVVEIDQVEPALEEGYLVLRFRLLQFEGCWWMTF